MILKYRLFRIHANFKIIENVKGRMVTIPQTFEIICPVLPPLFGVTRFYGTYIAIRCISVISRIRRFLKLTTLFTSVPNLRSVCRSWIRIPSDPELFAGSGSEIRILGRDPDHQFKYWFRIRKRSGIRFLLTNGENSTNSQRFCHIKGFC